MTRVTGLGPGQLDTVFPFHLVCDEQLRVRQVGPSLARVAALARPGADFHACFTVAEPRGLLLQRPEDAPPGLVLLDLRPGRLRLRGQLLAADGLLVFLGSPWVRDLTEIAEHGLQLSDFAVHDPVVDVLMLLQTQQAGLADARRLADQLQQAARTQARLAQAERRLAAELDALPDLTLRVDAAGQVIDFRPAGVPDTALAAPQLAVGSTLAEALPHLAGRLRAAVSRALEHGTTESVDYTDHQGGRAAFFEARVVATGEQEALVLIRDLSERKALEDKIVHQAFHDSLTGLVNRALFGDRLEHALTSRDPAGTAGGETTCLLYLDLDGFKQVNDTLGHRAGDALLVQATERLRELVGPQDTLARLGGDEFAVVLATSPLEAAEHLAERMVTALQAPFDVEGRAVRVGASIGVAAARNGDDSEALLRRADEAMYAAKRDGRGRWVLHHPLSEARSAQPVRWEADLRTAVEDGQLTLAYQPVVALDTGALAGFEALARWRHPVHGTVPPADFIPAAEATGTIVPLGEWVLQEACRQAVEWSADLLDPGWGVNVNLSPRQLREHDLPQRVEDVLARTGLLPHRLTLEVTETALHEDIENAAAQLRRLRAGGVRIALDDFGTGFSSLSHLSRFEVDQVKIDKSFIDGVGTSSTETAITAAVIQVARQLGLEVIAEGVESAHQAAALRTLHCPAAQGYHFARPMTAAAVEELLSDPARSTRARAALPLPRSAAADAATGTVPSQRPPQATRHL